MEDSDCGRVFSLLPPLLLFEREKKNLLFLERDFPHPLFSLSPFLFCETGVNKKKKRFGDKIKKGKKEAREGLFLLLSPFLLPGNKR